MSHSLSGWSRSSLTFCYLISSSQTSMHLFVSGSTSPSAHLSNRSWSCSVICLRWMTQSLSPLSSPSGISLDWIRWIPITKLMMSSSKSSLWSRDNWTTWIWRRSTRRHSTSSLPFRNLACKRPCTWVSTCTTRRSWSRRVSTCLPLNSSKSYN